MPTAIAIAAHPDDIEFQVAGTLVLLQQAGWETHYLNLSTGNCGSATMSAARTRRVRLAEGEAAARLLGAHFHPPMCDDLEILYDLATLRRLASVLRAVKPSVVLTHSPRDYMEDHMNTCRLAVTAAFSRGMPNFKVTPHRAPSDADVTLYHFMPHGLCDGLREPVVPHAFVNTTPVHTTKLAALAAHKSQQGWLDVSQGMNSYLQTMEDSSRELGRMSRRFKLAEGLRRHLHLGFSGSPVDPLRDALGKNYLLNRRATARHEA